MCTMTSQLSFKYNVASDLIDQCAGQQFSRTPCGISWLIVGTKNQCEGQTWEVLFRFWNICDLTSFASYYNMYMYCMYHISNPGISDGALVSAVSICRRHNGYEIQLIVNHNEYIAIVSSRARICDRYMNYGLMVFVDTCEQC